MRRRDAQENEPGSWKGAWGQTESASQKPRGVVTEGAGQEWAGRSSPWVGKGKRPLPPVRKGGLGPELREERGEEEREAGSLSKAEKPGLGPYEPKEEEEKKGKMSRVWSAASFWCGQVQVGPGTRGWTREPWP